ncbi:interferon-induced protein 44-like [Mercenaria mercenaria]|uniref:interferon-induced protein 44-like n=1 Tax=Mercenaria mercenaria TaxID=6596 RepID=UPI00234E5978|nr:interferon-induced protein 44-like [Mercenaria mercenaria]
MAGRLTNKDRDQLEKWIGTGPKSFTLLYAITRDRCEPKIFHEKCDNQGPTVTVVYNTQGSVYGGYNATTWTTRSSHQDDCCTDAFLFQLYFNGNPKANKFTLKKGRYQSAIHNDPNWGPTFGHYELKTFTSNIVYSGSYFPLNGGPSNFGSFYEMQGMTKDEIYNNTMDVIELEVYKVTYDENKERKPWRGVGSWNKKLLERLKDEIITFKPVPELNFNEARIALIGPVGAGKSSFYNTIDSVFRERVTQRACSGSAEQSITTKYIPYTVRLESGDSLKFLLCDTPGLEDSAGLDVNECTFLLDGNIPDFYLFNKKSPLTPKTESFKNEPTIRDMIHCVVFVLDATTLDVLSSDVLEKMKNFQTLMNERGTPQMILLTKIDKLCKDVQNDISFTYKSWLVEEHVEKASQRLGLRRSNVLPVKNYEKECELDLNINILASLALRQILRSAEDFMYNLLDRQKFAKIDIQE